MYPFEPRNDALTLLATANTYRLLACLWLHEVHETLAREMNATPLREAYLAVGGELPPTDANELESLAQDYCRLFIGPREHLPPVQSVWNSGAFQSNAAESMQTFLRVLNLEPDNFAIVDHLGVQFIAMATILEIAATEHAEQARRSIESLAASFFADHLRWTASLTDRALTHANTDFYKALMRVTADFLAQQANSDPHVA